MGVSISEFWDLTPFELSMIATSYREKHINDYNQKVEIAYLNAYFKRVEKMPKVDKFYISEDGKPKAKTEQSAETMLQEIMKMNSALGGTVY